MKYLPVSTRLGLFAWMIALSALTSTTSAQQRMPNKLIATGWDSPTAAEFRKHVAEFEKWPFDGVTIFPTVKRADGSTVSNGYAFSREKWAADACAGMISDLQATPSRIKAHSFLFCYANPGDVDWFDEAGWTQIVSHWRQLARAARAGGLRGLLFDAEPYTASYQQFNDARQAGNSRHTFPDYVLMARRRGREVMQAVASEYPNITLFSYRLLSDLLPLASAGGGGRQALSGNTYALLPAFVDGWLDAAPAGITVIEGDEDIGYRANSPATFDRAYARLRIDIPALLDTVHAGKYHNQVRISHGLYLDAYTNPPTNPWYIDPLGGTPTARLEANVVSAFHAADSGYVWLYGETGRWWPTRAGATPYPLWSEKLKGVEAALLRARDPAAAVRAVLTSVHAPDNLLHNARFALRTTNDLPSEWWTWQQDNSKGQGSIQGEALRWAGAAQAVFGQNVAVKPGTQYAVRGLLRHEGHGTAFISIGWKDAQGRWSHQADNVLLWPFPLATEPGWGEASGIVTAPVGSASMIVMFAVNAQTSLQDWALCRQLQCAEIH